MPRTTASGLFCPVFHGVVIRQRSGAERQTQKPAPRNTLRDTKHYISCKFCLRNVSPEANRMETGPDNSRNCGPKHGENPANHGHPERQIIPESNNVCVVNA
jgi:hypothetical protein